MAADWWTLWASLVVCVAALCYYWWCRHRRHFARLGVPFLPPLPLVGNMLDLVLYSTSFTEIVKHLYDKFPTHPYAGIFSFTFPVVMISDPELISLVTVKDFDRFTDHMDFVTSDKGNPLLSSMLFSLKGKEWHDMSTTLSPAFTSMKMKNMFVLMSEIGQQMVQHLTKETAQLKLSSEKEKVLTLELSDFFSRVTNDVIATTAFGVKVDSLAVPNNEFFTMGRDLSNVNPLVSFGYFMSASTMEMLGIPFFSQKTVDFFSSLVMETIETRQKQGIVRHDMMHLMQARRGELAPEEGHSNGAAEGSLKHLTDEDIAAQAMLFFFAGFETVSTVLTFCCYLLATNQDEQRRLQQEVDQLMDQSGGQPSYDQVMSCQYLDMVISETLRMYPPAPFLDRECVRAYSLPATDSCPGVELRPRDAIWIPVHGIHNDPKYFPQPDTFSPERFTPENKQLIEPFTYFPFGSGPRICMAQSFALMEMKIVMLYLMSQFSVEVVDKTPVPMKLDPSNSVSVSMKGGAWLGIRQSS
uniref:Cytochrome P450 CYP9AQ1 n=1 Tax=Locusta migratoria TaxID=7004 RepID=A0A1L1VA70_LOCMI|nr:cytochrome P450 CYP9AQ1 [Locusta migratoria]